MHARWALRARRSSEPTLLAREEKIESRVIQGAPRGVSPFVASHPARWRSFSELREDG